MRGFAPGWFLSLLGALLSVAALDAGEGWAAPAIRLEQVAAASAPVAMAHAGDGRMFICEKAGVIRVLKDGVLLPTPFLDIRSLVTSTDSEQGLLGLAFHPNYAANGYFYVNYINTPGNAPNNPADTAIARYRVSANPDVADPASGVVLMVIGQPFTNHNGGQLKFGPDGYLYIGMGDGGSGGDPSCYAQREDTLLGKMLRLDVNQNVNQPPYYGVPASNPFVAQGHPMDKVWAKGLRNPWRFSFDRATGDLYIADVGQNQWEEVSRQPASSTGGENYGWKIMEGNACFGASGCPAPVVSCNSPALTMPIHVYGHSSGNCSITGGYVYRGAAITDLPGRYVFGDYCSGRIWELNPATNAVTELHDGPFGLTTFGEAADGELYVAYGNTIYKLINDGPRATPTTPPSATPTPTPSPTVTPTVVQRCACPWAGVPGDSDNDGLIDAVEFDPMQTQPLTGGNRYLWDSDGDGLSDGAEDSNLNGQRDAGETDPRQRDSDGDQMWDSVERLLLGTNPLQAGATLTDADNDGLPMLLDPNDTTNDTDGDRFADGYEAVHCGLAAVTGASQVPALGDVNCDGFVSNADALITQSLFLGIAPRGLFSGETNLDANRDGFGTSVDSLIIQSWFLRLTPVLPVPVK